MKNATIQANRLDLSLYSVISKENDHLLLARVNVCLVQIFHSGGLTHHWMKNLPYSSMSACLSNCLVSASSPPSTEHLREIQPDVLGQDLRLNSALWPVSLSPAHFWTLHRYKEEMMMMMNGFILFIQSVCNKIFLWVMPVKHCWTESLIEREREREKRHCAHENI